MNQRVVLDTNVIVSAMISPNGVPSRVLQIIWDRCIRIYYCSTIMCEYVSVLSKPRFNFSALDCENMLLPIRKIGILVEPHTSSIPFIDESDRKFYDIALRADAILITGNLKHYPDEPFIVSPAAFLASIE